MRKRGAPRTALSHLTAALFGAAVGAFSLPVLADTDPAASGGEDQIALTFGQAREMAADAWLAGNVPLANRIAHLLTEARPEDVASLMMLSATETALGRPKEGREAGRRAFAEAESADARYQAAYLVSSGAMAEERYGAAQYWLRRAYHAAETEAQRDRIADAFGVVRRVSPWQARLFFDVAPSSNVNGGSQSPFLVIDDSPFVGVLSGAARALSGWEARFTASLSYTVSESATHRTTAVFNGYRSFVTLSEEAKDIAPRAEGSDFEFGVAEVELRHRILEPPGPLPDTVSVAFGQTWYGGEELDKVGRLTFGRTIELSPRTGLRLTVEGERRLSDRGEADRNGTELGAVLFHRLDNGLNLRGGVLGTNVSSDDTNSAYTGYEVFGGFWMSEDVMGMRLSGRLGYRELDYSEYSIGFINVPDGRSDQEWRGRVNLHVDQADVWGFVPVLSVLGETSTSNISRFEGESFGFSVGFESAF